MAITHNAANSYELMKWDKYYKEGDRLLQTKGIINFLISPKWSELPTNIHKQSKLCLFDLIGVAAGGSRTKLSRIARDYVQMDMTRTIPMIFDGLGASVAAVAF